MIENIEGLQATRKGTEFVQKIQRIFCPIVQVSPRDPTTPCCMINKLIPTSNVFGIVNGALSTLTSLLRKSRQEVSHLS